MGNTLICDRILHNSQRLFRKIFLELLSPIDDSMPSTALLSPRPRRAQNFSLHLRSTYFYYDAIFIKLSWQRRRVEAYLRRKCQASVDCYSILKTKTVLSSEDDCLLRVVFPGEVKQNRVIIRVKERNVSVPGDFLIFYPWETDEWNKQKSKIKKFEKKRADEETHRGSFFSAFPAPIRRGWNGPSELFRPGIWNASRNMMDSGRSRIALVIP